MRSGRTRRAVRRRDVCSQSIPQRRRAHLGRAHSRGTRRGADVRGSATRRLRVKPALRKATEPDRFLVVHPSRLHKPHDGLTRECTQRAVKRRLSAQQAAKATRSSATAPDRRCCGAEARCTRRSIARIVRPWRRLERAERAGTSSHECSSTENAHRRRASAAG